MSLGKLGARALLAGASLGIVIILFVKDLERTSPGDLSLSHAGDPRLAGGASCDACHGERGTELADACAACHAEVGRDAAAGTGFHGALPQGDARACGSCHREHLGAGHALAGEGAFALAGFATRDAYDHRGLAFQPAGKHAGLACAECHAAADAPALAPGERRFLGLDPSCGACHDDPHAGRMRAACADCHDQGRAFDDFAAFVHASGLELAGGHAGLACTACHARDGPYAIELLSAADAPPAEQTCASCHASPHSAGFAGGAALRAGVAEGAACAQCHDPRDGSFSGPAARCPPALHEASGFSLAAPHADVACAECHAEPAPSSGSESAFAERYPGRDPMACEACHADPHGGQFDGAAFAAAGCRSCHGAQGFVPSRFDAARHAETAFALTGRHAQARCDACHAVLAGRPAAERVFKGTARACSACHADAHGPDAFAGRSADCAACHTTEAFDDAHARGFEHGRWTGFALEGAHARAACEACHAAQPAADAVGRRFGRAASAATCAGCHADPHADAPWTAAGERPDCSACHTLETFEGAHARDFDHGRWTGFALAGRHVALACEGCHAAGEGGRLGGVAERFPGPPGDCATCHADPHAGAFARRGPPSGSGREGCARCHTELGFELPEVAFDHAWTGYPLVGGHARLRCAVCHAAVPEGAGGPEDRRFARAAGTRCDDCHADPHAGQFSALGRTDCARCHADAAVLAFDHDATRFPLDERHGRLACGACHRPWPLPGGGTAVRYRPLGTTCADCHGPAR